jgi:hypothetical protein
MDPRITNDEEVAIAFDRSIHFLSWLGMSDDGQRKSLIKRLKECAKISYDEDKPALEKLAQICELYVEEKEE